MIRALLDSHGVVEVMHHPHGKPVPDGWTATAPERVECHHHHYSQPIVRIPTMKAGDIASTAAELVGGERERTHGDKTVNHLNIARLWNAYLGCRLENWNPALTPRDVAVMMALLKIARTTLGAHNPDDYVDGCGYMAVAGEIADGEPK